ncbi:hypothetical protein predicted by Glimmer/Critica (plasmid) [Sinorhizobium fredii HH103]|uniref:Uncharacterized protein n=1 Tax=Sinorhizobium fredii (strain HH103) TaxID=1117943 RepID=G9AJQ7_SINF1|nr:hypothetical protein AB395_00006536 [Sinorhizobium fredii CCBAU 45436]CCF01289.1 hypothetical protein predicted by Glimmer/Critica [Sinorhizobium fredii HH103]
MAHEPNHLGHIIQTLSKAKESCGVASEKMRGAVGIDSAASKV